MNNKKLLLISNSTRPGEPYLGWVRDHLREFITDHGIKELLFIPYAGVNLSAAGLNESFDVYTEKVQGFFSSLNVSVHSVHHSKNESTEILNAPAIVAGGGNTFCLVKMLHEKKLMDLIREKALGGTPFIGWSAGANIACPTMMTTNDMPIAEPPSFRCLNLVPFQINPHFISVNPEGFGGETREQRIAEFLTMNRSMAVIGLREGTILRIEGDKIELKGESPLRFFRFGKDPEDHFPGEDLSFLLIRYHESS